MSIGFVIEGGVLVEYSGNEDVIVIPNGVIEIGSEVFKSNNDVTEVIMPDSVVIIGDYAFNDCKKLKSITLSKNIEEIGYDAFRGCKSLKEIDLPASLKKLGSSCFVDCDALKKITCESKLLGTNQNPFYSSDGKVPAGVADKDGFIVLSGILFAYIGNEKEISIPEGVTHIAANLFRTSDYSRTEKYTFNKVILPSTLKYIGDEAFANCTNLKSISMPSGIGFGGHVFVGCKGLCDENGLFISDGVAYAYCGNSEKVDIPEGTKELHSYLFEGKKEIREVVLPESLEVIGERTFHGCSSLEKITIPDSVITIGDAAFKDCSNLKIFKMPESVKNIGEGILRGCRNLADEAGFVIANDAIQAFCGSERNIVIPEGITSIEHGAFNKSGIKTIKLPTTLKKLGSAFTKCDMLEEIVIPEGITKIEDNTFLGCTSLVKVVLPSSIESIGEDAFKYCHKLTDFDIPKSVSYIGEYAFSECEMLKKVTLPANIRIIEWGCFNACHNLCEVVLPEKLEIISKYAFDECLNLKKLVLPDTVRKIYTWAFAKCKSLEEVVFKSSDIAIDESAFYNCPKLIDKDGFRIINGKLDMYEGEGGSIVVPEGVTEIAENVFREGTSGFGRGQKSYRKEGSLKEIVLPSTLVKIGNHAFAGCTALSKLTIPDSVVYIGSLAFGECASINKLTISSNVEFIGLDAFRGCKKMKAITVEESNSVFSSDDGILMNKSRDAILYVPSGKKLTEYMVPSNVKTIEKHAFIDCNSLKKIVIPASVESIGDEAFPRKEWGSKVCLSDIVVDPKAGSGTIGAEVFDIYNYDAPLVFPKIPVTFVREGRTQVNLALGFCLNPDKYEGDYAELYKKYVASHEKTLTKKAESLKLKGIKEYFSSVQSNSMLNSKTQNDGEESEKNNGYKPNLSIKKPSELAKVEILEEVVQKGTLQDLIDVLNTYKTFEMTARALGLAARFRGVEFVDALLKGGASFKYKYDSGLQRKYQMIQPTASGSYSTEYYLMVVPKELKDRGYSYSAMCGIPDMNIPSDLIPLSLEKRIEVVKYLADNSVEGVSLDEMLFWALQKGELDFADALMGMGVNLQMTPPSYYSSWGAVSITYIDLVTSATRCVYWDSYLYSIAALDKTIVFPVMERLNKLAIAAGKKLIITQKMFDEVKWTDDSLSFVIGNVDMSKVNQKKAMEMAVSTKSMGALEIMANAGWLSNAKKREGLIEFARTNKCKDALAWLMDYKNKNVDIAKEEAKEEAKMLKELMEDPNSVSALKKKWSYVKLDDGTLQITSYKGDEENVEVPSVIGKMAVTSIGKEAFSYWKQSIKNAKSREKIKTVVVPDGVKEIGEEAFCGCKSIEKIQLPTTIKHIDKRAFFNCYKLKSIEIPEGAKVGVNAFRDCGSLANSDGLIIVGNVLYDTHNLKNKDLLVIPDGVTKIANWAISDEWSSYRPERIKEVVLPEGLLEIGDSAFQDIKVNKIYFPNSLLKIGKDSFRKCYIKELELPEGLTHIGKAAFAYNEIKVLRIPKSLKTLPANAFYGCTKLRDAYIPATVEKLGDCVFGEKAGWNSVNGLYVHTPKDSVAEEYLKQFSGVFISNDYEE